MKNSLKLISVMLVLCMVLVSFSACGNGEKDESSASGELSVQSAEGGDVTASVESDESTAEESLDESSEESETAVELDELNGNWVGAYVSYREDVLGCYSNLYSLKLDGKGNGIEDFTSEDKTEREFMYAINGDKVAFVYLDTAEVVNYYFSFSDELLLLDGDYESFSFAAETDERLLVPEIDPELLGSWYLYDGEEVHVLEFSDDFGFVETYGESEDVCDYYTYADGRIFFEFGVDYTYEVEGNSLKLGVYDGSVLVFTGFEGDISEILDTSVAGAWVYYDEYAGESMFVFQPDGTGFVSFYGYPVPIAYELKENNGILITMSSEGVTEVVLDGFYERNGDELMLTDGIEPIVLTKTELYDNGDDDNIYDMTPAENVPETIYGMWETQMVDDGFTYTCILALRQNGTGFMTAEDLVVEDYEPTEEEIAVAIEALSSFFSFTVDGNTVSLFIDGEAAGVANMIVDGDDMILVIPADDGENSVMYFTRIVE